MASITCIYCKNVRERPAQGEHVMLGALGGTIRVADVCGGRGGCNQKFGNSIDRELLRNSPVTLLRLMVPDGQSHAQQMFYFREDHEAWLDAFIDVGERKMIIPPQLYLHGAKPHIVASPVFDRERTALATTPIDQLMTSEMFIQDCDQHAPPRLVLQPQRRRCIVRARSKEDCTDFFETLKAKLPELASTAASRVAEKVTLGLEHPLILPLGTAINDAPRCAAKMAFNFLSYYIGPNVALRPEFDSLREYICGTKVATIEEVVLPNGEVGVTVDTRHVANWLATVGTASRWKNLRDAHYVVLLAHNREIGADVGLFGGRCRFLVRLGKVAEDLVIEKPLPAVLVTPIGGGGDRVLAGSELVDALAPAGYD